MEQRKPTAKELDYLRKLIDADIESGSNAVNDIVDADMERCQSTKEENHVLDDDYRCIVGLSDIGLLKLVFTKKGSGYVVDGLTSYGRYYFDEAKRAEEEERRKIRGERRFQIVLAIITALLSFVFAVGAAWLTADRLTETRLDTLIHAMQADNESADESEPTGHLDGGPGSRAPHVAKGAVADTDGDTYNEQAD